MAISKIENNSLASGVPSTAKLPAGTVLQVVSSNYLTQVTNSTANFIDTGLTATITPTSATSKILVLVHQAEVGKETGNTYVMIKLLRGATGLADLCVSAAYTSSTATNHVSTVSGAYLDSPATTSPVTYKTQFNSQAGVAVAYVQLNNSMSTITLMEIAA